MCGLGSSVSEEFTVCIFRKHSEDGDSLFLRTVSIPSYFVSMWKETIPVPLGLK